MLNNKKPSSKVNELSDLTWEYSIVEDRKRSEARAWTIAKISVAMSFICIIAVALAMPLRQTVTRIVSVDKLTGETGVVSSLSDYVTKQSDINDKHWIKKFVIAHERYNINILQSDFDTVKILSNDAVYGKYKKLFEGANALQTKLADKVEIIPTILSIALSAENIATVRYETKLTTPGVLPETSRFIATLNYRYAPNAFMKEKDLIDNPLGFIIDAYQVDPEVVATTDTTSDVKQASPTRSDSAAPNAVAVPAPNGVTAPSPIVPAVGAKS